MGCIASPAAETPFALSLSKGPIILSSSKDLSLSKGPIILSPSKDLSLSKALRASGTTLRRTGPRQARSLLRANGWQTYARYPLNTSRNAGTAFTTG